jgi:hypothetical protein
VSFANPAALLWALPLGAFIVAFYLMKMRRRDVRVPATFLWPSHTEEVRANAPLQRLKPNLLLFLQLLAMLATVGAMARPQTRQAGLTGEVTVIVVDASASMSATDVKPSRFAQAKSLARDAIQGAKPGDRMALIEAGPIPRVVFPLGNDSARNLRAVDTLRPTDAESDVGEALRLAAALVSSIDGARIVLLSDGVFGPVEDFSRGKAVFVYKSVGISGDNLGIEALGAAPTAKGRQLFCGVRNYGPTPMAATLSIYGDGKLLDSVRTGTIAPGKQFGKTLAVAADTRVFEAKLGGGDNLAADDYAVTVAAPGANLRVLLVGPPDPFLDRALGLDPRVVLDRARELPDEERGEPGGSKYDVIVFNGVTEERVKARGVLALGKPGPASLATADGTVKAPRFIAAEATDLLDGVDFRGLYIDQAARLKAKPGADVLAETDAGPLVLAQSRPEQRQVLLGFAPLASDFPLQVAFPIFIANTLDYLAGGETADELAVRAGATFAVATPESGRLVAPDGTATEIPNRGSSLVVRSVQRVGPHRLELGGGEKRIFAYLRSERESDIVPEPKIDMGGGTVQATAAPARFGDFWRPIALLVLLILAGEWWLFVRRS